MIKLLEYKGYNFKIQVFLFPQTPGVMNDKTHNINILCTNEGVDYSANYNVNKTTLEGTLEIAEKDIKTWVDLLEEASNTEESLKNLGFMTIEEYHNQMSR